MTNSMATKTVIIGDLGESALLLPQRLQESLAANDRIKFYFTVLQAAESHALHPQETPLNLSAERAAAHMTAADLETAVAESRCDANGTLHIPGAERIRRWILDDIASMNVPLALAGIAEEEVLGKRQHTLATALPAFTDDRVSAGVIGAMTSANRASGDSLHILVMDLHKALNALQASLADESIDGARVWRVDAADRPLIRAFMSGINKTAPLKFDHPGLATTVTRSDGRLIIQNDIGTTDAHVLVLHVEGLSATLTYTDVHARRLKFFQSPVQAIRRALGRHAGRVSSERLGEGAELLSEHRPHRRSRRENARALPRLSRIAHRIPDRLESRAQTPEGIPAERAIRYALLKWAADNNIGHRGFIKLGGERLLYEAIEFAQRTPLHYGERLHEALGAEAAFDYLKFVLREATTGLLQGRSERFIRDSIKAELARRLHIAHSGLLAIGLTHAERVYDLATAVQEGLLRCGDSDAAVFLERTARRATGWEQECDAARDACPLAGASDVDAGNLRGTHARGG